MSREITNNDSQFCAKNWQLALEHSVAHLVSESEDKEMTPTQNHTLVAALLSLLSIVIFSGITSAQQAPVVTSTLSGAVATPVVTGTLSGAVATCAGRAVIQHSWRKPKAEASRPGSGGFVQ